MRFLLDPRLHLALIAALIVAIAVAFRAEWDWQVFVGSPSSTLHGRTDYRP